MVQPIEPIGQLMQCWVPVSFTPSHTQPCGLCTLPVLVQQQGLDGVLIDDGWQVEGIKHKGSPANRRTGHQYTVEQTHALSMLWPNSAALTTIFRLSHKHTQREVDQKHTTKLKVRLY